MGKKKLAVDFQAKESTVFTRDSIISAYYNSVRKYNVLTAQQEYDLLDLYHHGNEEEKKYARDKLVLHNQRFIIAISKRYANNVNLIDLIEEANIGLIQAIDLYDFNKNARLLTYAVYYIRRQINSYIAETSKLIKPINAHVIYHNLERAKNKFMSENCRFPTDDELLIFLKTRYGITITHKEDLHTINVKSLNDKIDDVSNNSSTAYEDYILYHNCNDLSNIELNIEQHDARIIVNRLLNNLNAKEKYVIAHSFGIGCENSTFDNIASDLDMTSEGVRAIYKRALNKLKKINIKDI